MFKNPFKRKTHADSFETAKAKGQSALSLFKVAHGQLEAANTELFTLIEDAGKKADELLAHIRNANAEINSNTAVQRKLKDFII